MEDADVVLNRAFAFWCDTEQLSFERLVGRMAWELRHLMAQDVVAIALVGQTRERRFFVSEPFDGHPLTPETLIGLLTQAHGEPVRVWDHALDTVRFLDGRIRASILVRISVPSNIVECEDFWVWCGSRTAASQDVLERMCNTARAIGEWLVAFGPGVSAMIRAGRAREEARMMVSSLRGILHDVRAPLGILKYAFTQGPERDEWAGVVKDELRYLERLLGQGAPEVCRHSPSLTADVGEILNRVRQRFLRENTEGRQIAVNVEYEAVVAKILRD